MTEHKCEELEGASLRALQTHHSYQTRIDSATGTPIAPAIVGRYPENVFCLKVLWCPYCGMRHFHGGGDGEVPFFGTRVAHCRLPLELKGEYEIQPVDLGQWAAAMEVDEDRLSQALSTGWNISVVDRRVGVPRGTAVATLRELVECEVAA